MRARRDTRREARCTTFFYLFRSVSRPHIEFAYRFSRTVSAQAAVSGSANSISHMKSDHAIPPAGISRRTMPPPPPTRATTTARHALPPSPAVPAPPRGNRRYLAPSPVVPRTRQAGLFESKTWRFLSDANLLLLALVGFALVGMFYAFVWGRQRVTIRINDQETTVWTRQQSVRDVLTEAGIVWNAKDIIRPGLDQPLTSNQDVTIRLATPIVLSADGNVTEERTQATTIQKVLEENQVTLKPQDEVFLDGRLVRADAALPKFTANAGEPALFAAQAGTLHISVTRALPITINDDGAISTLLTTENTLGTALTHAGLQIYVGDSVTPDLTTPVTTGATVYIRRSRPASITVDGKTIRTRTRADTVDALLSQEGVKLEGKDYAVPAPTSPVVDNVSVSVTRVREEYITETEQLPFQTKWLPNNQLELDQRLVAQTGQMGEKNRLFKSVYENGKLISTGLEREWIAKPPQDHIINYGTNIVVRDLTLPDGSVVQYWRKIRMLATAYSAATSGKTKDHPQYGRTRLGLEAGRGIVAVDPRVINLGSNVFVPGYGEALAGDTGGRIKGKRVDLGFPEDQVEDWYRWVDVYLLTPVPPKSQLTVVLADYPVERKTNR